MTDEVDLPLAGVRVVEIGQLIAIPSAGQQLSDLGAEVIKLEPPGGEPARQIDADYARGIFYGYNRGKRSICLDLKDLRRSAASSGSDRIERHLAAQFASGNP